MKQGPLLGPTDAFLATSEAQGPMGREAENKKVWPLNSPQDNLPAKQFLK